MDKNVAGVVLVVKNAGIMRLAEEKQEKSFWTGDFVMHAGNVRCSVSSRPGRYEERNYL